MPRSATGRSRREFVKGLGLGAAALFVMVMMGPLAAQEPAARKLNIILIYIDDLGWKDAGFLGSTFYVTPNINRLAAQGMVFTSAYANAPNCAPSRASLLTGLYPPRHGIYTVGSSERGPKCRRKLIPIATRTTLNSDLVTIAEALRTAGYVSASIGKWHLGSDPGTGPTSQGFEVNVGGGHEGHPKSYFSPYGISALTDGPDGEYLTDRLTDEALKFIEAKKDHPFFLYLPHYAVHSPIQAKQEMIARYKGRVGAIGQDNATYAAMIESTDQGVGRIMDKLDQLQLTDRTAIFFLSDNGGSERVTSMVPLRGSKGTLYEGGIRVPMVVRWNQRVRPGSACDVPVTGADIFSTVLEMTGVHKPASHVVDGESLVPLLTQTGPLKREAIFWHFPAYVQVDREMKGTWKMTPAGAVRQGDWKLIEFFEDGRLELYNLKEDVGETKDLASAAPEKAKELQRLLADWRRSVGAPVPTQRNPKYDPNAKEEPQSAGEGPESEDAD